MAFGTRCWTPHCVDDACHDKDILSEAFCTSLYKIGRRVKWYVVLKHVDSLFLHFHNLLVLKEGDCCTIYLQDAMKNSIEYF